MRTLEADEKTPVHSEGFPLHRITFWDVREHELHISQKCTIQMNECVMLDQLLRPRRIERNTVS